MNIDVHEAGWCLTPDGKFHDNLWDACRHLVASGVSPRVTVRFKMGNRVFMKDRIGDVAEYTMSGKLWVPDQVMPIGSPIEVWWRGVMFRRRVDNGGLRAS